MNLRGQKLSELGIIETEETKTLLIDGRVIIRPVFKIPVELLRYNILNGRIFTEVNSLKNKYEIDFDALSQEESNNNIENLIWDTEPNKNKSTLKSIESYGQLEAGVIITDTTVIDGNRRFTCLRKLSRSNPENDNFSYFRAAILDPEEEEISDKEIRKFELSVQFGQEEKVDYNPLNKALSIYNDINNNNIKTKEMADILGETVNSINNKIETIKVLHDYLEFMRSKNDFEIAKKLKVYYALEPLASYIKKKRNSLSQEELEKRKRIYFSYLTFVKFELPTQDLRNKLINKVFANPKFYEVFVKDFSKNYSEIVFENVKTFENIEPEDKYQKINEFKVSEDSTRLSRLLSDIVSQIDIEENLIAPVETLQKVLSYLRTIDVRIYQEIGKSEILSEINQLLDEVIDLSENLRDQSVND